MNKLLHLPLTKFNGFPFKLFTIATLYLFTHKNTTPPTDRLKFSDFAVGFILSNLKRMLLRHARLILGAKNQLEMLEDDLRLFKAFLRDSVKRGNKNQILNELLMEISVVVTEGEDVIDAFVAQAAESRDRNFLHKLGFGGPIKRLRIAKKIESVRIKVKGIYNKVGSIDFAALQIGSLNQEVKTEQIESLRAKVRFLQDLIEDFDQQRSEITEDLENKIEDAAHAVEDVIETKMVDHILGESEAPLEGSTLFCQKIEELIEEFDSIMKVAMKIKEGKVINDQLSRNIYHGSSSRLPPIGKITMVGFDEELVQVMDELTGQQPSRQIFPIVGMGGIGKTTLCRNVYENPLIIQHFHIRAWITISQVYTVQEILLSLLRDIIVSNPIEEEPQETTETFEEQSDDELGSKLYKRLSGRKYLIVMDDIWNIEVWDEIKMFFPDSGNGSRIMVTTRISDVAIRFSSCSPYKLDFLDEYKSWNLLCEIIFGQEDCPDELKEIGKEIAKKCRGLPLAIVVIGGLLAKSDMTRYYWEYVADDVSSIVNSEDDEHCSNILSLSYRYLPIHLKPCFLYMGIFPEDYEIRVSRLVKLWVAEGFLKPIVDKSFEEVAEEYFKDLVDRNLILVSRQQSNTKMKSCRIHDLLRDLCHKEAHRKKFLCVAEVHSLKIPSSRKPERRLVIHGSLFDRYYYDVFIAVQSESLTRSLFCDFYSMTDLLLGWLRLLRILDVFNDYSPETVWQLINARYLRLNVYSDLNSSIPSSIKLLQNLQTLIVTNVSGKNPIILPSEIWEMPLIRHIEIKEAILPEPPMGVQNQIDNRYLVNLQTLSTIRNFTCEENVLKRIPNLKKLEFTCEVTSLRGKLQPYCLNNLSNLLKLDSLRLIAYNKMELGNNVFPLSLKKLNLSWCMLSWSDMTIIGSLPNLEVLKLKSGAFIGKEWNPVEGEFLKLKLLLLENINLCNWQADSTHFPRLETLMLRNCRYLEEIPSDIGEIPTLQLLEVYNCSFAVNSSAEKIQEEQRSLGNDDLQVRLYGWRSDLMKYYKQTPREKQSLRYIEDLLS